jgi:hypothetical protein
MHGTIKRKSSSSRQTILTTIAQKIHHHHPRGILQVREDRQIDQQEIKDTQVQVAIVAVVAAVVGLAVLVVP